MNLVPIAGGTTAPTTDITAESGELIEFASIMTGLLAGDSQIAPVIDLPQVPIETTIEPESDLGEPGAILEMVGTPPHGVTYLRSAPADISQVAETSPGTGVVSPTLELVSEDTEPVREVPTDTDQKLVAEQATSALGVAAPQPEVSTPGPTPTDQSTQAIGASITATAPPTESSPESGTQRPEPATSLRSAVFARAAVPEHAGAREHQPAATPNHTPRPGAVGVVPPPTLPLPSGKASPLDVDTQKTVASPEIPAAIDEAPVDADLDASVSLRSLDPTRPTVRSVRQPITVGIARRVEEAIAALATKPDPKVVTLQLDELDGIRLTVALRPDGVHLSSTGDPRLTFDIERALASRGFDLSSEGRRQQNRGTPDEPGATAMRPQSSTRRRTTDPNAIKL